MNNLKDILAKIEQGSSWVSYDKISGTGPDKVAIKVEPGWMGRLPRETYVGRERQGYEARYYNPEGYRAGERGSGQYHV